MADTFTVYFSHTGAGITNKTVELTEGATLAQLLAKEAPSFAAGDYTTKVRKYQASSSEEVPAGDHGDYELEPSSRVVCSPRKVAGA